MSHDPLYLTSERLRALVRSNVPAFLSGYLRRVAQASLVDELAETIWSSRRAHASTSA